MSGDTVVDTISDAVLRATSITGTYSSNFSINSSGFILGSPLGITPVNIGTEQSPQGYYCTASFVYTPQEGSSSEAVTASVYQQYNIVESAAVSSVRVYSTPESSSIVNTGATVKCYGTIVRTLLYTWTSTSQSQGTDSEGTLYLYIDEEYKTTIYSGGYFDFVIPENPYDYDIEFYVTVKYVPDQEVTATATITQAASVLTYDRPVIFGDCDMVPASGGTSYFVGYATQAYYRNGTRALPDLQHSVNWSVASYTGLNLHKNPTPETTLGTSTATCTANGQTAIPVVVECIQEENKRVLDYYEDERINLNPDVETQNASVSVSATNYTDSNNPCSAGGGTCTLQYNATADKRSRDKWKIETTTYYTWTSGDTDEEVATTYHNGEWSSWASVSVDPDIERNQTWSRVGYNDTITIDSRGTVEGSGRSVVYTASYTTTNGVTDSDTVTLYQQENIKTEPHDPVRSLEITTSGAIVASGGTFVAHYVSKETYGLYIYTSGAQSGTESTRAVTGTITCTNCNYNGSAQFNVSGEGDVTLTVPANTGQSSRYAVVLLDGLVGDSIEQYSEYTLVLMWGQTTITNNYEFTWSRPRDIPSRIALTDSGSNQRVYSFSKSSGNVANIDYNIMSQTIEVTGITAGMDDWFEVYEASSNQSVRFTIKTNML